MRNNTLHLWQRITAWPAGRWIFSRLVCLKAPYFGTIRPRFVELRPGYAEVRMKDRRAVHNHIGTVHAIAMCNLAEIAAGTITEVTVPATHRWIPKGMTVSYLKKATTDLVAIATLAIPQEWAGAAEHPVEVMARDKTGEAVFQATINMWVSPRRG